MAQGWWTGVSAEAVRVAAVVLWRNTDMCERRASIVRRRRVTARAQTHTRTRTHAEGDGYRSGACACGPLFPVAATYVRAPRPGISLSIVLALANVVVVVRCECTAAAAAAVGVHHRIDRRTKNIPAGSVRVRVLSVARVSSSA